MKKNIVNFLKYDKWIFNKDKTQIKIDFYFIKAEYEKAIRTNNFHKRIDYIKITPVPKSDNNEQTSDNNSESSKKLKSQPSTISEEAFVFHSPSIVLHYTQANQLDEFGNLNVKNSGITNCIFTLNVQ